MMEDNIQNGSEVCAQVLNHAHGSLSRPFNWHRQNAHLCYHGACCNNPWGRAAFDVRENGIYVEYAHPNNARRIATTVIEPREVIIELVGHMDSCQEDPITIPWSHSCCPNEVSLHCVHEGVHKVVLASSRKIRPGAEITNSYGSIDKRQQFRFNQNLCLDMDDDDEINTLMQSGTLQRKRTRSEAFASTDDDGKEMALLVAKKYRPIIQKVEVGPVDQVEMRQY